MKKYNKMTEKIKVVWFNHQKGFGEGISKTGSKVFLHYKALDPSVQDAKISPEQTLFS